MCTAGRDQPRRILPLAAATFIFATALAPRLLRAGDWPQILGPKRNGQARQEQLLTTWPKAGPRVLWTKRVGQGYAGPAVAGDRVVIFHRVGDTERVEALEAATGKRIWKADFPADYRGGINPDTGPRCVPLVDAARDRVFLYGAAGRLHCVSFSRGAKRWSRNAREEYHAGEGYFGAGSTPIIADEKLLVNVGAHRQAAGLVAFALDSGKTIWEATRQRASYSSPTLIDLDGKRCVVFVTRLNTVCVDPHTGKVRFQFPFGRLGPTVNAATPLVFDGYLFVTASYGIGAKLVKIAGGSVETVWASDEVMSSQYSTCVYRDGYLYGTDGREDVGRATLRCVEARTGTIQWSVDGFGVAHMILAGDKLLILQVDGRLVLAQPTPRAFRPLARARIFPASSRALPALAHGRLFARSNARGGGQLKCLLVGKTTRG